MKIDCADSESDFRIRISFELKILVFPKTHVLAHLPNYVEFWDYKIEKILKLF
jgi:hypothetical protein